MEEELSGGSPRGQQQLLAELFHSSILQRNDDTLEFLERLGASPPKAAAVGGIAAATARRFCFTADCSSAGLASPQPSLGFSISSRADSPSPVPSASLLQRQQHHELLSTCAQQLGKASTSQLLQQQHQPTLLQACLLAQAAQRLPQAQDPASLEQSAAVRTPAASPPGLASPCSVGGSVFEKSAGWGWADCGSAGGSPRSPAKACGSPRCLGSPPLDERRQQMTRVSATIDELLSAIVGDMLVKD